MQECPKNVVLYANQVNQQGCMIAMKMISIVVSAVVWFGLSTASVAAVYQCKQANGSVSFQTFPCPAEAQASTLNLPQTKDKALATRTSADTPDLRAQVEALDKAQKQKAEAMQKAQDARLQALEKHRQCKEVRNQQGLMLDAMRQKDKKSSEPVDKKERAEALEAMEEKVKLACS